ncbi:aggregation-promoting factor C-terminal-like domain-containing protein [Kurthia sibirica]|uniref:Peptidoglycan-binding protein LysM n=1 Tax=Kurthia sibirica TaxID=202750 RepID=A0A2U3ALJ9_9BACL|nr:LysM peptidoglycan-binding domain-containing protein [Kurthia sibirica]PWI25379.1 peptidoglycan-binding protein LysM [Kurthia sibirica]GEK34604.1 peptidase M23 [Kurthia sibirica]
MKKQCIALMATIALAASTFTTSASAKTVEIKTGDTLSTLAQQHNTTVDHLKELNDLTSNLIFAGDLLEVGDRSKLPTKQGYNDQSIVKQQTVKPQTVSVNKDSSAKAWIAQKESSNNYSAVSATGKYIGKYQLDRSYLNGDHSPENQERVADKYVKERYGSWENAKAAWLKQGWY